MTAPVFTPHPREGRGPRSNIKIELTPAEYEKVKRRAAAARVSLKAYVRQALDFAMEHEA